MVYTGKNKPIPLPAWLFINGTIFKKIFNPYHATREQLHKKGNWKLYYKRFLIQPKWKVVPSYLEEFRTNRGTIMDYDYTAEFKWINGFKTILYYWEGTYCCRYFDSMSNEFGGSSLPANLVNEQVLAGMINNETKL